MLKHWVSKLRPAVPETPAPKTSSAEPTRKPGPVAKAFTAVGIKPPSDYVDEPPDLRRKIYHSAWIDHMEPRHNTWIFPYGYPHGRRSWWER